jgi:membrane-bound serine protease (ClpP class)
MNYPLMAIALMIIALTLVFAEVFVPSGGMLSIILLSAFVSSLYCAYLAWWEANQLMFVFFTFISVGALPMCVFLGFYLLENSRLGKGILLDSPTSEDVTAFADEEQLLRSFIGQSAKTITPLNPGGLIQIDGQRVHCYSQGVMIDRGEWVKILDVQGTRVVVAEFLPEEHPDLADVPKTDSQIDGPPATQVATTQVEPHPEKIIAENTTSHQEQDIDFELPDIK